MKGTAINIFFTIIISLIIVYFLQPLNAGAITLVFILSGGFVTLVSYLLNKSKRDTQKLLIPLILSNIFLTDCASPKQYGGVVSNDPALITSRSILYNNDADDPDFGAYCYILLTSQPSSGEITRAEKVAELYLNNFAKYPENNFPNNSFTKKLYAIHYWPLDIERKNSPQLTPTNLCKFYNFTTASHVLARTGKSITKGPIIVAWSKSFNKVNTGDEAFLLDLSNFADEDIDRAFKIWRTEITKGVEKAGGWHYNLIMARENIRNTLQQYGGQIATIVLAK